MISSKFELTTHEHEFYDLIILITLSYLNFVFLIFTDHIFIEILIKIIYKSLFIINFNQF